MQPSQGVKEPFTPKLVPKNKEIRIFFVTQRQKKLLSFGKKVAQFLASKDYFSCCQLSKSLVNSGRNSDFIPQLSQASISCALCNIITSYSAASLANAKAHTSLSYWHNINVCHNGNEIDLCWQPDCVRSFWNKCIFNTYNLISWWTDWRAFWLWKY